MMKPNSPDRLNEDSKVLARTLLGLAMPRLVRRAIVIAIVTVLWWFVCRGILSFGAGVRYDGLAVFGQQAIELLNRINPYLWWAVVALVTLIFFFALRGWYAGSLAAGRATPVEPATLRELGRQLSPDAIKVLEWVWRDREDPLTVGDLHATLSELRHGRVGKLYLAREQEAALRDAPAAATPEAAPPGMREPSVPAAGSPGLPAGTASGRAEPRLSDPA